MKKLLILSLTLITMLMMTATCYAAPSVQLENPNVKAVDKDGKSVEIVVDYITDAASAGEVFVSIEETDIAYNLVKDTYPDISPENVRMISLMNITIKGDAGLIEFPVTLTFEVNSVEPTTKAYVLHYEEGEWVLLDGVAGDGTITVVFDSLSPVSIFVDASTLGNGTDETAPNTGDSAVIYIALVGIMALAGLAYMVKKTA